MNIKICTLILFLFAAYSCNPWLNDDDVKEVSDQYRQNVLNAARFDPLAMQEIRKLRKLAEFLNKNADTIIRYRNSINHATVADQKNKDHDTLLTEDCYLFSQDSGNRNSYHDPHNFPTSIWHDFNTLLGNTGGQFSFEVCYQQISFVFKTEERDSGLSLEHNLVWETGELIHTINATEHKDSVLSNGWIYRIYLYENHGW